MGRHVVLTPAYGRDYKNKADAIADFERGADFALSDPVLGGGYVAKADLVCISGVDAVEIRYKKQTQVAIHKIK